MSVPRLTNSARFRLAHLLVPLVFATLLATAALLPDLKLARAPADYVIDPAAWGAHQSSGAGRWIVLGPRGDETSRVSFETVWTEVRVEDHQAFRRPHTPAGRVEVCKTSFETEGLRVVADSCRSAYVRVSASNDAAQPRLVLIEGR